MDGLVFAIVVLIAGAIYFIPAIVAHNRGMVSSPGVFVLNLVFGWTLLGWVIALIWALSGPTEAGRKADLEAIARAAAARANPAPAPTRPAPIHTVAALERLARLRESGALTEQEFIEQKTRVLTAPSVAAARAEPDPHAWLTPKAPPAPLKQEIDDAKAQSRSRRLALGIAGIAGLAILAVVLFGSDRTPSDATFVAHVNGAGMPCSRVSAFLKLQESVYMVTCPEGRYEVDRTAKPLRVEVRKL